MAQDIVTSPVVFLGGYLVSFNSSFGFNSSPSTLNATILSVPGEAFFNPKSASNAIGTLHQLDLTSVSNSTFKFTGILTAVTEKIRDISGTTWELQFVDARAALQGISLVLTPNAAPALLDDSQGRIINIYDEINKNVTKKSISSFELNGTRALDILTVLGMNPGDIGTAAGIALPSPASNLELTVWGVKYIFGFDGIDLINTDFKITGDVITLMDFFQQLGDGNAFDWFVDGPENIVNFPSPNLVQIQTISRQVDDTNLSLASFITSLESDVDTPVSAIASGTELRQDPTGAVIISDNKEFLDSVTATSGIDADHLPLAIPDVSTETNPANFHSAGSEIVQPHRIFLPINKTTFDVITDASTVESAGYLPEDDEFRAALAGFENWILYLTYVRSHPIKDDANWFTKKDKFEIQEQDLTADFWTDGVPRFSGPTKMGDLHRAVFNSAEYTLLIKIKNAFEVVRKAAQELYGRVYVFPKYAKANVVSSASTRTVEVTSFGGGTKKRSKFSSGTEYELEGADKKTYTVTSITGSKGVDAAVDTFFDDGNGNGRTTAYACFIGVSKEDVEGAKVMITENPDNITFSDGNLYVKGSVTDGLFKISPVYDLENTPCSVQDKIAAAAFTAEGVSLAACLEAIDTSFVGPPTVPPAICQDILTNKDSRFMMNALALVPDSIFIPYKHQEDVWQVFKSPAGFGIGPILVEKDESLSPANFSNFTSFEAAGDAKIERLASPIKDMQTGHIVGVGLPRQKLGDAIGFNSNITNISVNFGASPVTTAYNLETFIKRFGKLDKQQNDIVAKSINKVKSNLSRLNGELLRINKEKISVLNDVRKHVDIGDTDLNNESKEIAFGCNKEIDFSKLKGSDSHGSRVPVGMTSIVAKNMAGPNVNANLHRVSIENTVGTVTPSKSVWTNSFGTDLSMIFTGFDMGVQLPTGGPETFDADGTVSAGDINPYKLVTLDNDQVAPFKQIIDKDSPTVAGAFDIDEVRGIALRLPMMLAGWGFDTDGDKILTEDGEKLDYTKWKVGPLDIRWDDTRKVWVAGGQQEFLWIEYNPVIT